MKHYPQLDAPHTVKAGETVEIRILLAAVRENNQKKTGGTTASSSSIKNYVNQFSASFNDTSVFRAKLTERMSAHPFISFFLKPSASGTLTLSWKEVSGAEHSITHKLKVK